MNYKLIMSDMDGTLLDDKMNIPAANQAAIHAANEKGIKFVMASGRMKPLINRYIDELSLAGGDNYVVCSNGACIYETKNNALIYEKRLELAHAQHIIKEAAQFQVLVHVYENESVYLTDITELEREIFTQSKLAIHPLDVNHVEQINITKIILVGYNDELLKVQKHFQPLVAGKMNMMFSSPHYLEFFNLEADKGTALRFLSERLSIPVAQIMAVGDNYNDVGMVSAAGLGVAVQNAVPGLKDVANYVTQSTNNDGVFKELRELFIDREPV